MQNQFIITPFFLDQPLKALGQLANPDWVVNKLPLPHGEVQSRMSLLHEAIARDVAEAIRARKRPISIAGDCCTTIGVAAGLQRAGVDPFLVWFDAHGDFNTWETTPSGFLGGMPLAMLAGLGEQTMPHAVGLKPIPQDMIILTDGRDLDPGERELIEGSKVTHLPDPKSLFEQSTAKFPLYIHFDTDVINPVDAPAMSYVATGGPRAFELEEIFRHLAQTGRVGAVSLSAWNPDLDRDGRSRETSMRLLRALLR